MTSASPEASAFYRAIHKGLRQIVANELGVREADIRKEVRRDIGSIIERAVNEWFVANKITTVDEMISRLVSVKLSGWGSLNPNVLNEKIEQAVSRQLSAELAKRIRIDVNLTTAPQAGDAAFDAKEAESATW